MLEILSRTNLRAMTFARNENSLCAAIDASILDNALGSQTCSNDARNRQRKILAHQNLCKPNDQMRVVAMRKLGNGSWKNPSEHPRVFRQPSNQTWWNLISSTRAKCANPCRPF
jgi:hypothetical protein